MFSVKIFRNSIFRQECSFRCWAIKLASDICIVSRLDRVVQVKLRLSQIRPCKLLQYFIPKFFPKILIWCRLLWGKRYYKSKSTPSNSGLRSYLSSIQKPTVKQRVSNGLLYQIGRCTVTLQMYGCNFVVGKRDEHTKLYLSSITQKFIRYYTF